MFQDAALYPWLTARGNLELALRLRGVAEAERRARALELLDLVHLTDAAEKRPHELSGGMRQRVAICRALANDPKVLLADEPTGNLDPHTAEGVFRELISLVRSSGVAAMIATHNPELAARMDRVVRMQDGQLVPV